MKNNHAINTDHATVNLTAAADYSEQAVTAAIEKQFDLAGLSKIIARCDSVLVKPNFITPSPPDQSAQTHPAVILAVVKAIKDLGAKPFIGDSPAWSTVEKCISSLGLTEPLQKLDVPFKQLGKRRYIEIAGVKIGISTHALEADKIINVPKLKAHQQIVATIAIKNMFGCVAGKKKAMLHFTKGGDVPDFCRMLVEIYMLLCPAVNIIDGIDAMQGQGPINGTRRHIGVIVGSTDPVACEAVCARIINLPLEKLPIVAAAKEMSFGCWDFDKITVLGDDCEAFICEDFVQAELTPLQFTFPRIIKSITKQAALLVKHKYQKR